MTSTVPPSAETSTQDRAAPASVPAAANESRIGVRIAEDLPWLLLPPGMSCQFVERPALTAVPNVRPWFVGAFAERGVITPIFDFARWLHPERGAAGRGLAILRDGADLIGFLSIDTPRVLSVPVGGGAFDLSPDAPLFALPDAARPFVGRSVRAGAELCAEFQPFAWVRANAARISIAS